MFSESAASTISEADGHTQPSYKGLCVLLTITCLKLNLCEMNDMYL
jgi:hypothetical protein